MFKWYAAQIALDSTARVSHANESGYGLCLPAITLYQEYRCAKQTPAAWHGLMIRSVRSDLRIDRQYGTRLQLRS
jgi:hypothetical protein